MNNKNDNNMKSNQNNKFIVTFNVSTAEMLKHMGLKFINKMQNGYYIFMNEPKKIMFKKLDDVTFTDKLLVKPSL